MTNYVYPLGHSDRELQRLIFQGEMLQAITHRMLLSANVGAGSSVLDIGCGVGGVSQLAARLVGPRGHVTGIDQSDAAISLATSLARSANLSNITYTNSTLEHANLDQQFDAVVGRAVLLFQPDVVTFLKKAARLVKPGGYIAFHEIDDGRQFQSRPKVEIWDLTMRALLSKLQQGCPQYDIAQRVVEVFALAGLPVPELTYEIPTAGGKAESLCLWATETLRSLSGNATHAQLADGYAMDWGALNLELQSAISSANAQVEFLGQVCAWARIPVC